ncbi:extracellular solute-binding protein [Amnibacterium sp. CER49]|uniref:ABC transporter substrate-binding protein n=1 Tax=Amnibacterium sp. CER49 TaxID=3039161 RepID=UPI00244947DA|nr:extracellular solute-binding protein [Amnibacterium sp. CER49]MDH2444794.1 extracellular solute-binding protein [Amnibacterium sp. CER49]
MSQQNGSAFTRRGFLGVAGAAAATTLLAACSGGGSGSGGGGGGGGQISFWNQPWGNTQFNPLDQKITTAYKPKSGLPTVKYQVIQWANFAQRYSTAVASNTNPEISSGGGTQAFLFESQGKIHYADDLYKTWQSNGLYSDFLPGLIDTLKTKNGYAAIPYNLDMRVMWYNKQLLDSVGATPPTTWDEFEAVCKKLKAKGIYGYGTYSGAGGFTGFHNLVSHMINNGGGLFNANQEPDCVTQPNIDAMNWVIGLVKQGFVDPRAGTYTAQNAQDQYKANKFGMGFDTGGLAQNVGGTVGANLKVASPLTSHSGAKGALFFPNNIMMYKHNRSIKGTEAFATYYYQNMKQLWTQKTGIGLPVLKSIADTPEFKSDPNNVKILSEWQPVSKTWGAPGGNTVFLNVTAVDGTAPGTTFTQAILSGNTTAKAALTTLQNSLQASIKK